MHAVLITFECSAPIADLLAPFTDYAKALQQQPGLVSKSWIATGNGYGGFHIFTDRSAADAYLSGDLAAGLMSTDGFGNFQVEHFELLDELSAMTDATAMVA